ncbi:MAG: GIY-YIG nuclease family protein [Proteiniphilum sp.]|nr:GIY-YIG nuclease family protein [Proteiniphilum sp.]
MARGKNINLYIKDGISKCTIKNWIGMVYTVPRTLIDVGKPIDNLNRSGVYLLLGTTEDAEEAVYIGQADIRKNEKGVLYRILEPHKSIDYWTESIIFTTVDNSLGATELNYLEFRLHEIALIADRCKVTNGGSPHKGSLPEEKEDEMEDFIDFIRLVVKALGRKVFEPVVNRVPESSIKDQIFHSKGNKATALAKLTDDGIVVLKGSRLAEGITKSAPKQVNRLRTQYEDSIDRSFTLMKDIRFSSPSAAAGFVGGSSLNGNDYWVTDDGISLGQYLTEEPVTK